MEKPLIPFPIEVYQQEISLLELTQIQKFVNQVDRFPSSSGNDDTDFAITEMDNLAGQLKFHCCEKINIILLDEVDPSWMVELPTDLDQKQLGTRRDFMNISNYLHRNVGNAP